MVPEKGYTYPFIYPDIVFSTTESISEDVDIKYQLNRPICKMENNKKLIRQSPFHTWDNDACIIPTIAIGNIVTQVHFFFAQVY
jgi:hypothetical protein